MASKNNRRTAASRVREEKALKLRMAGATYQQIGDHLGISRQAAWKAIDRVLERTRKQTDEDAPKLRALSARRLDAMLVALWERVEKGDEKAIATALKISERHAKLFGLDAPKRTEGELTVTTEQSIKFGDREIKF